MTLDDLQGRSFDGMLSSKQIWRYHKEMPICHIWWLEGLRHAKPNKLTFYLLGAKLT